MDYLQKNQKDITSRTGDSEPTNRLTHMQEILNYLEIVHKHSRNASNRFEKDISSKTRVINEKS